MYEEQEFLDKTHDVLVLWFRSNIGKVRECELEFMASGAYGITLEECVLEKFPELRIFAKTDIRYTLLADIRDVLAERGRIDVGSFGYIERRKTLDGFIDACVMGVDDE